MKDSVKKRFSVTVYLLSILIVNLPWFVIGGNQKTIYELYHYAIVKNVGFTELFQVQLLLLFLYQFFSAAYVLTVFAKKNWHLNMVNMLLSICLLALSIGGLQTLAENLMAVCYANVIALLSVIEFVVPKAVDAMRAEQDEMRSQLQQEKEAKVEKKKRLYFAGKYNNLFFRMIWKNFRYNWRDYMLFLICGAMTAALTLTGIGSYEMMSGMHSQETFIIGEGLGGILWKALLPIGVCIVVLMVFVLLFYLKKRMIGYSMFLVLGARKKTMHIMIALEIVFNILLALIFGGFLGNGVLWILRKQISKVLGESVILAAVSWHTYLKMFGVTIVVYLIALAVTRDIALDLNISSASSKKVRAEKMPRKRLILMIAAGMILSGWSLISYSRLRSHEDIKLLAIFFAGIFLIIRYGMAWYLIKEKKGRKYLPKLIKRNYLYHHSRTAAWYLTALSLVSTCALSYFTMQVTSLKLTENADILYPYDFMCIGETEDEEFFRNLKNNYSIELVEYPMVRVSTTDGTPFIEPRGAQPVQGQHIGISETTYHELKRILDQDYKENPLGLDGTAKRIGDEKVYVVHQQDRSVQAQPIEWSLFQKKPFLHIGQPCPSHAHIEQVKITGYPPYTIAGEEICSLTGCFRQGLQENLIVFSDAYFEKAQDMWKDTNIQNGRKLEEGEMKIPDVTIRQGPTKLVLIRAEKEDLKKLENEMEGYTKMPHHQYDMAYNPEISCYYSKQDARQDMEMEQMMRKIVNVSVIVTLMVTYVHLIWIKVFSEMNEKKRRSEFLKTMGMRRKERIQLLNRELYLFLWIPVVITIIATAGFTAAAFHARMYTATVIKEYISNVVWIWEIGLLFEGLIFALLDIILIKRIEKI